MSGVEGISGAELSSRIGVAVARKAQDAAKAEGEAVLALLEGAVKLARGSSRGAVSAAAGAGETGGRLDVEA